MAVEMMIIVTVLMRMSVPGIMIVARGMSMTGMMSVT